LLFKAPVADTPRLNTPPHRQNIERLDSLVGSPSKRALALDEIFQVSRALADDVENKRKLYNPKT
jgi:hypothetical protein